MLKVRLTVLQHKVLKAQQQQRVCSGRGGAGAGRDSVAVVSFGCAAGVLPCTPQGWGAAPDASLSLCCPRRGLRLAPRHHGLLWQSSGTPPSVP